MSDTKKRITEIGRVIIPVSDQERALEFYVGKLGFEKRMDVAMGDGYRWIEVAPPGAKTTIALAPPPAGQEPGPIEISFATGDADAARSELEDLGVDADEEVARFGEPVPPMFSFRDTEGNSHRIVETD